jgi:hypothetical protein
MAFPNRVAFTKAMTWLLSKMIDEGENVLIDYCKRSDDEQRRIFKEGLSKCDGVVRVSQHQKGRAVDLYFVKGAKLIEPIKGYEYWHDMWQQCGGSPIISWDKSHFE